MQPGCLNLARRDIGLIVRGDLFPLVDFGYNYRVPVLAYAIGVVNGCGPQHARRQQRQGPDRAPRVHRADRVQLVAAPVHDRRHRLLRQAEPGLPDRDMARARWSAPATRERYGVDVYYNHWPFGVTYEYIRGKDDDRHGHQREPQRATCASSDSHTGTLFLSFGEQFVTGFRNQGRFDDWWPKTYQPFFRYDRFNADVNKPHDLIDRSTRSGFNLFFAETTKFQLNYNLKWDTSIANDIPATGAVPAISGVGLDARSVGADSVRILARPSSSTRGRHAPA